LRPNVLHDFIQPLEQLVIMSDLFTRQGNVDLPDIEENVDAEVSKRAKLSVAIWDFRHIEWISDTAHNQIAATITILHTNTPPGALSIILDRVQLEPRVLQHRQRIEVLQGADQNVGELRHVL